MTIWTAPLEIEDSISSRLDLAAGSYTALDVSRTGCRVKPEIVSQLFEPFFTTKELAVGAGLELSTAYEIVRHFGGYIAVKGVLGEGVAFRVILPRVDEPSAEVGENSRSSTQTVGCETIRLVEDKERVRPVIHETLRASGYTVIVVDRPEVARHLARGYDGQIDLLLTDVAVPEVTGVRLAERLGSEFDDLKVLYISGYTADSGVLFRGYENNHFLQKPFLPATLSKTVREVLADAVPKTTICASSRMAG